MTEGSAALSHQRTVPGKEVRTRKGMLLKVSQKGDVAVASFTIYSIVDVQDVQRLSEEFTELLEKHKFNKLVVDFEKLGFMTSNVITILLNLRTKLKEAGGELRVCKVSPDIYNIFRVTHLDKLIPVHSSVSEAVQSISFRK
jgi:anti-sigma B factor antagonist